MPELPEVETIKRGIKNKLIGKKIIAVDIKVAKLFIGNKNNVIGAKITDANRIAKILIINLSSNYSIIIHLKMSGQLIYKEARSKNKELRGGHGQKVYDQPTPHNYTYITYTFSDGSHLYFNDFRKFGWHKVVNTSKLNIILGPDKYGPEPNTLQFSTEYLKKIILKTSKPIKQVIMDQQKISGVGNIYANDGLYDAGILPTRQSKTLSDDEIRKLKKSIEKVIKMGIKYGGSSENTYVDIDGKKGNYTDVTLVYQKKFDPKGHMLTRVKIGGRGSFYCEKCQK